MESAYERTFRAKLDSLTNGLSANMERLPSLDSRTADRVLDFLLETACKGQNDGPIGLARRAVAAIPRGWLIPRLASAAERCLDIDDDWEYRRLLELCMEIGPAVAETFVKRGRASRNPEVVDAAKDFEEAILALPSEQRPEAPRSSLQDVIVPVPLGRVLRELAFTE